MEEIGLDPSAYGTHSIRRTKPTLIYRRTKNLRAVQLLLGHTKLESTVRYLGIEVDDALEIAEQTEVQSCAIESSYGTALILNAAAEFRGQVRDLMCWLIGSPLPEDQPCRRQQPRYSTDLAFHLQADLWVPLLADTLYVAR